MYMICFLCDLGGLKSCHSVHFESSWFCVWCGLFLLIPLGSGWAVISSVLRNVCRQFCCIFPSSYRRFLVVACWHPGLFFFSSFKLCISPPIPSLSNTFYTSDLILLSRRALFVFLMMCSKCCYCGSSGCVLNSVTVVFSIENFSSEAPRS